MSLLSSIFLRRLLLPLVGVLGSALAIVAIVALVELSPQTTSEIPHHRFVVVLIASLLAMTVALGWSALIIWRYRRIEGEAIGQALHKALSRSDAALWAPPAPPVFPQIVDSVFDSFQKVMTQASQDKAQLLTIIASMSEGLMAIDHHQRILLVNRAARN